jgi:hypothetical protein
MPTPGICFGFLFFFFFFNRILGERRQQTGEREAVRGKRESRSMREREESQAAWLHGL